MRVLADNTYPLMNTYVGDVGHIILSGYSIDLFGYSMNDFIANMTQTVANTVNGYGFEMLKLTIYEEQVEFWEYTTPVTKYTIDVHFGGYGTSGQGNLLAPVIAAAIVGIVATALVAALAFLLLSVGVVLFEVYAMLKGEDVVEVANNVANKVAEGVKSFSDVTKYAAIGLIGMGVIFLAYQVLQESKQYRPEIKSRLSKSGAIV